MHMYVGVFKYILKSIKVHMEILYCSAIYQVFVIRMHNQLSIEQTWYIFEQTHSFVQKITIKKQLLKYCWVLDRWQWRELAIMMQTAKYYWRLKLQTSMVKVMMMENCQAMSLYLLRNTKPVKLLVWNRLWSNFLNDNTIKATMCSTVNSGY